MKERFHSINLKRKQYFNSIIDQYGLNLMEIEILGFLSEEPDSNTFTDIMRAKDYAKSHISTAITNLVNSNYIEKCCCDNNKKVQQLFLLERSGPIIDAYNRCVNEFHKNAFTGLTSQELEVFNQVIDKINDNLSKEQEY
ncbi:MAG: MarR family winged helix-turn-helix transcriptional regulator [Eubacteriales bacterium]